MRQLLTCSLALVVAAATLGAQGPRPRGTALEVFDDIHFGGRSTYFADAVPDLRPAGLENRISSLRISGGESWEVCEGRNFTGRCDVFSGEDSDLRKRGWNDRIASLRPVRGAGRDWVLIPPPPTVRGLQLFAGTDYSGERLEVQGAAADFRRLNFSDRALSVRVPRGESWEVCINIDYDNCRVIDADIPNLGSVGLSRIISSARPHVGGRDIGDGRDGARFREGARIVLYDSPSFRGRAVSVDGATPTLTFFNDRAGSIEVFGGRWEICDRPGYGGRCITISDSVRDLRTLRLDDRVSSVRPR